MIVLLNKTPDFIIIIHTQNTAIKKCLQNT